MGAGLQCSHQLLFKPISEFVSNEDLALALGDEVDVIVLGCDFFVLLTEYVLWSVQYRIHPLNDVVDDVLVVSLPAVKGLVLPEQMLGYFISLYGHLEDLDRAQDAVRLRDASLHELVELILQRRGRVSRNEKLIDFASQLVRQVQCLHRCVDSVHLPLEVL